MGMTIDEVIKVLEQHHMWTGEPQKVTEVRVENSAMGVAIEIMHKYQKIQNVMDNRADDSPKSNSKALGDIEVIIYGNVD